MRKATTIEQQLAILRERGVEIPDDSYARSVLLEVGYYRLGFYLFPFEKSYPHRSGQTRAVIEGTKLEDIVSLYYADTLLRELFLRYISIVEVCFRTRLCYYGSIECSDDLTWFTSERCVSDRYIEDFDLKVYNKSFRKNEYIRAHHQEHKEDKYAPAWKTIEFMTFGATICLFESLKSEGLKKRIARSFRIDRYSVLDSYLTGLKTIRNKCAHGAVLFDISLPRRLKVYKPISGIDPTLRTSLYSVYLILKFLLVSIGGERRGRKFEQEMVELLAQIRAEMPNISEMFLSISKLSYVLDFAKS